MKRVLPLFLLAVLVLSGCVPAPPEQAVKTDTWFVQDFWVIDSATALNKEYEWIELLPALIAEHDFSQADTTIDLLGGVTFYQFDSLKPKLANNQGSVRKDVDMVAGFLQTSDATSVGVLASPHRNMLEPIGITDNVLIDFTAIDELLEPGDPVLLDYALLQAVPVGSSEEYPLTGLDLLKYRFDEDRVFISGTEIDGTNVAHNYVEQMGLILEGSDILGLPAKSQDMVDGLWDGAEACIEEFRDPLFGLKCTQSIFEDFGLGAVSSWQQIEENFEPYDVPAKDEWERYNAFPEDSWIIPEDAFKPKKKEDKCMPGFVVPEGEKEPDCPPPPCTDCNDGGTVIGDPHITSFDGKLFPMHGVGEFLLAQNSEFTLQMRTQQTVPDKQLASVSAVAFEYGDLHVYVDAQSLVVNGQQVTDWYSTFGEHYVVQNRSSILITNGRDYNLRLASLIAWEFNIALDIQSGTEDFIGMLGNNDGAQNDFFTRSGEYLGEELDFDTFYQTYVNSWRISQDESLFPYETGRSTDDYTDLSFPQLEITSADFSEAEQDIAERICIASGLKYADFIEACKLDLLVLAELDDLTFMGEIRTAANHYESAVRAIEVHRGDEELLWGVATVAPKPWEPRESTNRPGGGDEVEYYRITWEDTAGKFLNFDGEASYSCPGNGVVSPVWGGQDGLYDTRSSICTAAVHAGIIDPMRGGTIDMMLQDGRFNQSADLVQNGITGQASENYEGFRFIQYNFEH